MLVMDHSFLCGCCWSTPHTIETVQTVISNFDISRQRKPSLLCVACIPVATRNEMAAIVPGSSGTNGRTTRLTAVAAIPDSIPKVAAKGQSCSTKSPVKKMRPKASSL